MSEHNKVIIDSKFSKKEQLFYESIDNETNDICEWIDKVFTNLPKEFTKTNDQDFNIFDFNKEEYKTNIEFNFSNQKKKQIKRLKTKKLKRSKNKCENCAECVGENFKKDHEETKKSKVFYIFFQFLLLFTLFLYYNEILSFIKFFC